MIELHTPLSPGAIAGLKVGDTVLVIGDILAGRDAVLPRLANMHPEELLALGIHLDGAVVFHTAVSQAGIGPTSSNKVEIEDSLAPLSRRGVRLHVGKGALGMDTVRALAEAGGVYAVAPPVSALQTAALRAARVLAFPEEGIEALHVLTTRGLAAVVAIAHGESIWHRDQTG